ncbi:MAG: hypothetical protein KBB39_10070 [Phycicoccus sp.]|nr:hypothetical protein [Phycicoccus sp.]
MSQLATARPIARTAPSSRPRTTARDLRVVTAPRAGHGGLLLICLLLLVGALLGVLLLNISMAKGAFALGELQKESSQLTDTAAEAQHALDRDTAPAALAQRALDLGMVPSGSAAFLRLSDGAVLGVAQAAPEGSTFSVVAQAPVEAARSTAASAPAPQESAAAPPMPTPGTTVVEEGTLTRTTVVEIREGKVVTTVTSADSATGITTTSTTTEDLPAGATAGTAADAATPTPEPSATP